MQTELNTGRSRISLQTGTQWRISVH